MIKHSHSFVFMPRQSGAALITGLIFLVVLTMIGITAARMSTLEERMSGNMRDRSIAMQAAELALRDAERDIRGLVVEPAAVPRSPAIIGSGMTDFTPTCTNGLCDRRGATPTYADSTITFPSFTANAIVYPQLVLDIAANGVAYGTFTHAPAPAPAPVIAGIPTAQQPRYIIEGISKKPPGFSTEAFFYRITVRAQGANPNTVVWLQEMFKP
jgi:type IV pilus assembly protein PilX